MKPTNELPEEHPQEDESLLREERIRRSHEDRDKSRRKSIRKREKKTFGALHEVDPSALIEVRVVRAEGAYFVCHTHRGEEYRATTYRGTKTANPNSTLVAVGDAIKILPAEGQDAMIEEVSPRKTKLSRRAAGKRDFEQVVVANVDVLVVVASTGEPKLRSGIIDRYVVAGLAGGLEIIIVLSKIDLANAEEQEEISYFRAVYRNIGYPVFPVSSVTSEGLEPLREQLSGRVSVFAGHSGVGKSSIINALFGTEVGKTGRLSRKYKRGAHTTTSSVLHPVPGYEDTYIADTPGVREFSNFELDTHNLKFHFAEFVPLAENCRIANCSHLHEPGCAVIAAVETGDVAPERYDSYTKLYEEARANEKRTLEKS